MSKRYEVDGADTDLEIVSPESDRDESGLDLDSGNYALVIGNPWASAFAIEGSPTDLREFARRVSELVQEALPNDAAHLTSQEP
ncbi:hypothetical protein ACTWP5_18880 [Streptomyces sp. 4N509B]|uniref:hypothetical protein n=1 Tax=Streptomyces sp. 4N509B TaxID=3457413 RepID=UPI003FD35E33